MTFLSWNSNIITRHDYFLSYKYNMEDNSIMAIAALVVSIGGSVMAVINHKRIRSNCCGAKLETSLDIESTTPPLTSAPPAVLPQ